MRKGSTLYYLLGDHLGSLAITATSTGTKSAETRYYPWGTERYNSGTNQTSFHFTGQRLESGIGLYFYGARWYDSAAGRFVQPDTIIPSSRGCRPGTGMRIQITARQPLLIQLEILLIYLVYFVTKHGVIIHQLQG